MMNLVEKIKRAFWTCKLNGLKKEYKVTIDLFSNGFGKNYYTVEKAGTTRIFEVGDEYCRFYNEDGSNINVYCGWMGLVGRAMIKAGMGA